jgi:hypothetical protein
LIRSRDFQYGNGGKARVRQFIEQRPSFTDTAHVGQVPGQQQYIGFIGQLCVLLPQPSGETLGEMDVSYGRDAHCGHLVDFIPAAPARPQFRGRLPRKRVPGPRLFHHLTGKISAIASA